MVIVPWEFRWGARGALCGGSLANYSIPLFILTILAGAGVLYLIYRIIKYDKEKREAWVAEQQRKVEAELNEKRLASERAAREAAAEKQRAAEAAELERRKEEQRIRLAQMVDRYSGVEPELPQLLKKATNALAQARRDFDEHAFDPFWDQIETTVSSLRRFDYLVRDARDLREKHREEKLLPGVSSQALAIIDVPDIVPIANELNEVVAVAQKDFQFTTIYQQRKTNENLVRGFGNLRDALGDLTHRIDWSVTALREDIRDNQRETERRQMDEAERVSEHYENVEEMLDNIQNRRKPD
jgi:hypothetical protein